MDSIKVDEIQKKLSQIKEIERSLDALNIINFDGFCETFVDKYHPDEKASFLLLKAKFKNYKSLLDRYHLDNYYIWKNISCDCNFIKYLHFYYVHDSHNRDTIKEINFFMSHRMSTIDFVNQKLFLRKYMKLLTDDWRLKIKTCRYEHYLAETQLHKFLGVCQLIKPAIEIVENDDSERHFLHMTDILFTCAYTNFSNSKIIVELLKIVMKMYSNTIRLAHHVSFEPSYINYFLHHAETSRFKIKTFFSENPNTLWEHSKNFSILEALAKGNKQLVLNLLFHDFEVYPEYEQKQSTYYYPNIVSQLIPKMQRMVLELMEKFVKKNWEITPERIECFILIWEFIPDSRVTKEELDYSIYKEFEYLRNNFGERDCKIRKERNEMLVELYKQMLSEIKKKEKGKIQEKGEKSKVRPLKELCKIKIEKDYRYLNLNDKKLKTNFCYLLHKFKTFSVDLCKYSGRHID